METIEEPKSDKKSKSSLPWIIGLIVAVPCLYPVFVCLGLLYYAITYPDQDAKQQAMAEQDASVICSQLGKAVAKHVLYKTLTSGPNPILKERDRSESSLSLHETQPYIPPGTSLPPGYTQRSWIGGDRGGWEYRIDITLNKNGEVASYKSAQFSTGTGGF